MSDPGWLAQMLPALFIFVGGPLLIWWLRRGRSGVAGTLKVSARTALTRNSVIAVIETDGKRFLVGATDSSVSLLNELDHTPQDLEQEALDLNREDFTVPTTEPIGPRTSPLEQLRVMTTRRVTRPRPPRVHHS